MIVAMAAEEQDVLAVVRRAVADVLEVDPGDVLPPTALVADLHADSLALVELVEILEEHYGPRLHIPDEDIDRLVTVQDVVDYVLLRRAGMRR